VSEGALRGAVAAGHPAEVAAGLRMLELGGNAVDAVVAGAFAAFVVEPTNCGLAGYGHLSAYLPGEGRFLTVDHGPRAPAAAHAEMFPLTEAYAGGHYDWPQVVGRANELGHLAPAVPGAVAGLCEAHARAGVLDLAAVLEPAIALADAGLEVDWHLTLMICERLHEIRRFADAAGLLLRDGDPPPASGYWGAGERLDTTALAQTLRRVAREGAAGFHAGPVAAAIEAAVRAGGGILSARDLADYRPKVFWEPPQRYRDLEYVTSNDQVGYEVLNILARFPLAEIAADEAVLCHLLGEAMGHAFADNVQHYGDPDHVASPVDGLASPAFAAQRAELLRLDAVAPRPIAAGDPWPFDARERPAEGAGPSFGRVHGTTQVAAADGDGAMASLITTIGQDFGCLVYVPEVGVFLNSSMVNYDPRPGRPGSIAPGKMPFFAVPSIVAARAGKAVFAAAGSGGYRILSGVVQTMVHAVDRGMPLRSAVDAPRVYCQGDELFVDERLPAAAREALARIGHAVVVERPTPAYAPFARVSAVSALHGRLEAASDPPWNTAAGCLQ